MGRPPKRDGERKQSHLHIRITQDLKEKLDLAAAREGMDLSTFARNLMIRRARELGIKI
jgi:uncharacterized protein (DUF1778 family)